uniref:Uncharacterized protein n=1 Tax=Caenorhabditis japonica TaxID=281687 RepID=A0A8R1I8A0_CAEJA
MIGGYQKEVFLEIIVIASQKFTGFTGYSPEFTILAGQEFDSKLCFAKVLPDQNLATIEEFKRQNISVGSLVTQVVTVDDQALGFASQNPKYLDESTLPHSTMFFASLRTSLPEYVTVSAKVLQMYLNDQVVRRVEDSRMMEKCVEELKSYLQN